MSKSFKTSFQTPIVQKFLFCHLLLILKSFLTQIFSSVEHKIRKIKNILYIIFNVIRVNADWSFKASEKDTKQPHLSPYESCYILIMLYYQSLAVNWNWALSWTWEVIPICEWIISFLWTT